MKSHSLPPGWRSYRLVRASIGLLLLAFGFSLGLRAEPAAEPAPLPRLAISPVIPPGADDGLDQGRTLADLLAVHLSASETWTLVERAQLAIIEDEWLLKGSDLAGRAASLRIGALSRADLVLECRVSDATVETPWCKITVVETARAEVLAEASVALSARPAGPWYRSPPETDAGALATASEKTVGQACARLAAWRGRPVAALLFSAGDPAPGTESAATLARLAGAVEAAGFRWVSLVPGKAAETEGLLNLRGYTGDSVSPWQAAADLYFWADAGPDGTTVSAWRPGLPVRVARIGGASDPDIAALVQNALTDLRSGPGADPDANRLAVAKEFLAEARRLWAPLGLRDSQYSIELNGWLSLPEDKLTVLTRIRTLLNVAGFFALEDREIQELRLVVAARLADGREKSLIVQRYCEMADRFWIQPDGALDARLCVESHVFEWIPFSFERRRIAETLARLEGLPDEALPAFAPMLENWARRLCGHGKDEASLALLEQVWPSVVRAMGEDVHRRTTNYFPDLVTTVRQASSAWGARVRRMLEAGDALARRRVRLNPGTAGLRSSLRPGLTVTEPTVTEPIVTRTEWRKGKGDAWWTRTETLSDGQIRVSKSEAGPPPRAVHPVGFPPSSFPASTPAQASNPEPRPTTLWPNGEAMPPLIAAAVSDNWDEAGRLLDAGADLAASSGWFDDSGNKTTQGQVLLGLSVAKGRLALAGRMLDAGVKPVRSGSVLAPLVSRAGKLDEAELALARRLIEAGARTGILHNPYERVFAASQQHADMLAGSEERRVASNLPNPPASFSRPAATRGLRTVQAGDLPALQQLVSLDLRNLNGISCIDQNDADGRTPLIRAILLDWPEALKALVAAGASLDRGRYQGRNARTLLAERPGLARLLDADGPGRSAGTDSAAGPEDDGPAVVAALLRGDAEHLARSAITPALLGYRDGKRWTVLHHAVDRHAEAYARRLIAAGAPLDALSRGGQTPLAFAAAQRLEGIVAVMLAAGAPVNLRGGVGASPLYQAAYSQNPALVRRLLDAGADLSVRVDDAHSTVAHAAASRPDNVGVLEVLFAAGADFQARSTTGATLLDWALGGGAHQNVAFLHAKGVRWREPSPSGLTPLQYAAREGQAGMVRELLLIGVWDEGALSLATSSEVKALLEDAALKRGSRVVDDLELWPAICADRINGRRRAEAHLANGGNVNFAKADGWGLTPLEMALEAMNPDLVRLLLGRGAIPRTHREGHYSVTPPSLWRVLAPLRLRHPESVGSKDPFPDTTLEAWDAYAADMINLLAARWPDPVYAELLVTLVLEGQPRSAAALRAAGVVEPSAPQPIR